MRALFLGLSVVVLLFPARSDAEVVLVDANGRTIGPFLQGWGTYIDDAGLQWNVDFETASLYVANYRETYDTSYFTEPNCAGPSYTQPFVPPRWVYKLDHWPFPRYRPDWLASQEVRVASYWYGSCRPLDRTLRLVPESELIEMDGPLEDLGACPPLHVEVRSDPK